MDDTLKKFFIMLFFLYILGVALISSTGSIGDISLPLPSGFGSIAKFEFTPPV
tara:strand:+ start:242 stop:400 length:159 start_codon:yes stop_codon:yes gene_type:complete